MDKTARKLTVVFAIILAASVVALLVLFSTLVNRYKASVITESASHLVEIDNQAAGYIEEQLSTDRLMTESIADSLEQQAPTDATDILAYLGREKETWDVDSVRIYTDSGICLDQDGVAANNDQASRTVFETKEAGSRFSISQSTIEYSIAIDSQVAINGNPVTVVSVVQNLDTLIESMGIDTFKGQSALYLTDAEGITISQSGGNTKRTFNAVALFDGSIVTCLTTSGLSLSQAMGRDNDEVFLSTSSDSTDYVVLTPVDAIGDTWYLFYIVPEPIVNQTMDGFTSFVMKLTMMVIGVFLLLLAGFYTLFRLKSRGYLKDIQAREHLMDLLVSETGNAYMILSLGASAPIYESANMAEVLAGSQLRYDTAKKRFMLGDGGCIDKAVVSETNTALASWDGNEEFASGYLPCGDGSSMRYKMLRLYPVQTGDNEVVGIVQDVTQDRLREEDLRNALTLADSANRAKTEFLSQMSHDIRTPMNAIVNMTHFATQNVDDPQKTLEYLDVIEDSSKHLLQLVNNVLDMSRIESGKLSFNVEPFDLRQVLRETGEIIRPLCEAKDQEFSLDFDGIEHGRLMGDRLRLNQILINLLNNAYKFTPNHGHVQLVARELHALRSSDAAYRFEVIDDGIGMDPATVANIFTPFVRADNGVVNGIEGSGLGLSITKNFVEAMGGTIAVESAPGKGSKFTVELFFPRDNAEGADAHPLPEHVEFNTTRFDGRRALLVEDNEVNAIIARRLLEDRGLVVDAAGNGKLAAERFEEAASGTYDIIFMDIQMPVMNGYEASRAIRASGKPDAGTVPIIAMTANVFAEDIEHARQAGMSGHVGKPIDPDALVQEMAQHLEPSSSAPDA